MFETNIDELVQISVMGEIAHPGYARTPYRITTEGEPVVVTGASGITYNIRVGDSAVKWQADHVEPAVSIKNPEGDGYSGPNAGLNVLACVGDDGRVVSGEAKGETGVVTGKHGGAERVMVDFSEGAMEKMLPGDKILIRAWGVGLKLVDYPQVKLFNVSPQLLEAWDIETEGGALLIPVAKRLPAAIMGSGLGANNVYKGDYDINLFDDATVQEYGLDQLRLGDFVAILDTDHRYGRLYRQGWVSIGIVIHGNSVVAGHGPGVTTLMTGKTEHLKPIVDGNANIASIMNLRKDI